jgi:hypothetical protein
MADLNKLVEEISALTLMEALSGQNAGTKWASGRGSGSHDGAMRPPLLKRNGRGEGPCSPSCSRTFAAKIESSGRASTDHPGLKGQALVEGAPSNVMENVSKEALKTPSPSSRPSRRYRTQVLAVVLPSV